MGVKSELMLPRLLAIGPVVVGSFGVMLLIAFALGSFVFWKRAKEEYYDEAEALDLVFVAIFWAVVGGRVVYALMHFQEFGFNIFYWLSFWSRPGLVWFGFLGSGLVAVVSYSKKKKWNIFKTLDLTVIGASMAHVIVNLGIFLNGGGVGKVTGLPMGVKFPGTFETRHPIGLYGALVWIFVFWFLWWVESRYRRFVWFQRSKGDARPGFLFFTYLIWLGLIGLGLEFLSEGQLVWVGVNFEIVIRMAIVLVGVTGLYLRSGLSLMGGLGDVADKFRQAS